MKTVRSLSAVAFLFLLSTLSADGVRADEVARFTSGLYLRVDGVMRTLYVEGPSLRAPRGLCGAETRILIDIDVEILLGDRKLGPGRHRLALFLDPEQAWRIAPEGFASRRKERREMTMTEEAPRERDLWVRFVRRGRLRELSLVVAWGPRRGAIDVIVDPGSRPAAPTAAGPSAAKLRRERDLLLAAVGNLLDVTRARGQWISVIGAIRDAAVGSGRPRGVILAGLTFELTESSLGLTGEGRTPGDAYDEVGEFRKRLQAGPLAARYTRIQVNGGDPIRGGDGRTMAFPVTIQADAPPDEWRPGRVDVAPGAGANADAAALSEEVAFLDDWLSQVADPARNKGVTSIRSRLQALLDLRRDTGMIVLPDPNPLERREGDLLGRYRVGMTMRGPTEGFLRFLDGIHGWGMPVWITVEKIEEGTLGIEARVSFEFLSYEPLARRNPTLGRPIAAIQEAEDFDERLGAYLKRFPKVSAYERYARRDEVQDPFEAGE